MQVTSAPDYSTLHFLQGKQTNEVFPTMHSLVFISFSRYVFSKVEHETYRKRNPDGVRKKVS